MGLGWLGSVAGSVLGGLFEQNSANSAYDHQMDMLAKQMDFSRESMQNHHQWEVNDLRQAGLNPLLSVSSPTGTLSSPSPSQVQKANISSSAAALGQLALNKEQIDVNKAQVKVQDKMAEAALINADAAMQDSHANMIRAYNDSTMVDFHVGKEFAMRSGLTDAQIDNLIASSGLARSQEALNVLQFDWLPKLLKADLDEKEMRIATGYLVAAAQDYYLHASGNASIISANAQSSQAAHYGRLVDSLEKVNESEVTLNSWKGYKAVREASNIVEHTKGLKRENKLYDDIYSDPDAYRWTKIGRTGREFLGGTPIGSFIPR